MSPINCGRSGWPSGWRMARHRNGTASPGWMQLCHRCSQHGDPAGPYHPDCGSGNVVVLLWTIQRLEPCCCPHGAFDSYYQVKAQGSTTRCRTIPGYPINPGYRMLLWNGWALSASTERNRIIPRPHATSSSAFEAACFRRRRASRISRTPVIRHQPLAIHMTGGIGSKG